MSRDAESAILGADFDMGVLHDGPAGSLSPDPQPVTKSASALSLSPRRWSGSREVPHLRAGRAIRIRDSRERRVGEGTPGRRAGGLTDRDHRAADREIADDLEGECAAIDHR